MSTQIMSLMLASCQNMEKMKDPNVDILPYTKSDKYRVHLKSIRLNRIYFYLAKSRKVKPYII